MISTVKERELIAIKKSKNGKGLFLKRNIDQGKAIFEFKGELITCDEDDELDEQTRSNTIRYNNSLFLSPKGRIGELINHSCKPNSKIVKKNNKLYIVSTRNIKKGEEIVFDYSTVLAADDIWRMNCNCGNDICRKVIKAFHSLPMKIKQEYIDNKMVPRYILNIK